MAINKVVYGNDTLIDLTNDTVEANNLLEGETAHDRSGAPVTGTAKQGHIVQDSSGTDMTQRSKLQFADAEVSDDSTNGKTVVTVVREMTRAQFNALSQAERYGIIRITDDGNRLIDASEVTYNNETVKSKLDSLTTEVNSKTDENPTFTEAETRANIASGETFAVILGKIKKWFSDLSSMFVSKSGDTMTGDLVSRAHIKSDRQNGTTTQVGDSYVMIGNDTPSGTAKNSKGYLRLYSQGTKYINLTTASSVTDNRNISLPDKSGTVAVTDSAQLASGIYLYRAGNIRVLHINGAMCSNVVATTIPSGDRPSNNKVFAISWFGYIGRMVIHNTGVIAVGHYQNYGVNTVSDDSASTVTVNACIAWGVD